MVFINHLYFFKLGLMTWIIRSWGGPGLHDVYKEGKRFSVDSKTKKEFESSKWNRMPRMPYDYCWKRWLIVLDVICQRRTAWMMEARCIWFWWNRQRSLCQLECPEICHLFSHYLLLEMLSQSGYPSQSGRVSTHRYQDFTRIFLEPFRQCRRCRG
jgi:hypothetical protein